MTAGGLARTIQTLGGALRLVVEEEFCVNLRGRKPYCSRCVKACPAAALSLSADAVDLDETLCTGCGACVPACPAGALSLSGFDPERFLAALEGSDEAHVHCAASRDAGGGVVVPCHVLLDKRLAAAALAEGTRRFVLHGAERCGDCPMGDARSHLARLGRSLSKWFAGAAPAFDIAPPYTAAPGERRQDGQVGTDRRGFLRLMSLQMGARPDEEAFEDDWPVPPGDRRRKRPAPYRAAVAERIARLPWAPDRLLPWHTREIAESCSACMVCADNCPTGALDGSEEAQARRITFDPALCTNCSLCQQICPEDAVRPRLARSVAEATAPRAALMHRTLGRCEDCGQPFVPQEPSAQLCTVCANERKLDEEWLGLLAE